MPNIITRFVTTAYLDPFWRRLIMIVIACVIGLTVLLAVVALVAGGSAPPPEPTTKDQRHVEFRIGSKQFGAGIEYERKYEGPASKNPLPPREKPPAPAPQKK